MSEKVINILKHEYGIETVIVEFGLGKIGIGLLSGSESQRNMVVCLQELNEAKNLQTKSLLPKCKDEAWITERKCEEAK